MIKTKEIPKSKHSKEKIFIECDRCKKLFDRRYDVYCKSPYPECCSSCIRKANGEKRKGVKRSTKTREKISQTKKSKARAKLTLACQYCQKEFVVKYGERHRLFCSKSCASKSRKGNKDGRVVSRCVVCNKEFLHYGTRILCSVECNAKYMSQQRVGENNPYFNPNKENISVCKNCSKKFIWLTAGHDKDPEYCSKVCWDQYQKGKNKNLDGPAVYGVPYPASFNNQLKRDVRNRDHNKCCLCGLFGKKNTSISVHHIDYDKENCDKYNLVCLCERCHGLTNFNRPFWQFLFAGLASKSKLIRKGWGIEIHIVNNDKYCLKYLVFWEGKKFSHHFHNIKQEVWHCVMGKFNLLLETQSGHAEELVFLAGDKLELKPGHIHQLTALKNSIITEVSTRDFPEDSVRISKGD